MALVLAAVLIREAYAGKVDENRHLAAQLAQATAQQTKATAAQVCLAKLSAPIGILAIQIQAATARYQLAGDARPDPAARAAAFQALNDLLDQQDQATKVRNDGAAQLAAGQTPPGCVAPVGEVPTR